jgi:Spy/CpxP family protein refolding chaperone
MTKMAVVEMKEAQPLNERPPFLHRTRDLIWAGTTGDTTTDDKMQPNVNDRLEQAKPEQGETSGKPQKARKSEQSDLTKNEIAKRASRIGKTSLAVLVAVGLLAARAQAQPTTPAKPPVDSATHAAHVAAGTHPALVDATKGDPALAQQLSELRVKVAQIEAALTKNAPSPSAAAAPAASAMPGMAASAAPMARMSGAAPGAMKPAGGMGSMAAPPGGATNMMGMMDKMMGMMDKMMSMGGGAMPAGAPAAGMSGGGGMVMDKMETAGVMGMGAMGSGAAGAMPQSVLPGFPGASHLYHIGATGFFLDHPQHLALTTEQQAALSRAKEQALLAKSTADRAIQQAEQELWTLTAADQPDVAKIKAKIGEIEKLKGDQRIAFIRSVGEAARVLTDEQRAALLGTGAPQAAQMTAPQGSAVSVNPQGGMGSTDPKAGMGDDSMGNMGGNTPNTTGNGGKGDM